VSVQRTTNQQKWTAIALRMPSASRVLCSLYDTEIITTSD